ncbi:MAG TPA: DUF1343 domain-containing protein [Gemmatimonadales bacterium]
MQHFRLRGSRLVSLFAPEHGIRGNAAPGASVHDTTDRATGLPIYSLYGANRAPSAAQMAKLDVLVVDLQDVGTRTWSYVSTTIFAMRAAKTAGKRIIVLDRPNPIGCAMQGPILDTAFSSMIGPLPVPLRHGMTMGELMRFANAELGIGADLVVVPVKGWHRCEWFDETGLPWVPPSPNLRDLDAVAWYPGTVLIEATNLSVGRGTDEAFREMGAPWLKTPREAYGYPNGDTLEHVTFTPHAPGDGKYDGVSCAGVRFWRNNRRYAGGPILEVIRVLRLLAQSNRDSLRVDSSMMTTRFGRAWNADSALAWASDQRALAAFRIRVRPYLLYL